jgi:hypothetical protein
MRSPRFGFKMPGVNDLLCDFPGSGLAIPGRNTKAKRSLRGYFGRPVNPRELQRMAESGAGWGFGGGERRAEVGDRSARQVIGEARFMSLVNDRRLDIAEMQTRDEWPRRRFSWGQSRNGGRQPLRENSHILGFGERNGVILGAQFHINAFFPSGGPFTVVEAPVL